MKSKILRGLQEVCRQLSVTCLQVAVNCLPDAAYMGHLRGLIWFYLDCVWFLVKQNSSKRQAKIIRSIYGRCTFVLLEPYQKPTSSLLGYGLGSYWIHLDSPGLEWIRVGYSSGNYQLSELSPQKQRVLHASFMRSARDTLSNRLLTYHLHMIAHMGTHNEESQPSNSGIKK